LRKKEGEREKGGSKRRGVVNLEQELNHGSSQRIKKKEGPARFERLAATKTDTLSISKRAYSAAS